MLNAKYVLIAFVIAMWFQGATAVNLSDILKDTPGMEIRVVYPDDLKCVLWILDQEEREILDIKHVKNDFSNNDLCLIYMKEMA